MNKENEFHCIARYPLEYLFNFTSKALPFSPNVYHQFPNSPYL